MKVKIVAIGGGGDGKDGKPNELREIDSKIVEIAYNRNPVFLFIGFAAHDKADTYYESMKITYSNLGCDCLHLKEEVLKSDKNALIEMIKCADIIYVGGGSTLRLMNVFRRHNFSEMLKKNLNPNGVVLCGKSAGAICWCKYGHSDTRKYKSGDKFTKLSGLGFINIMLSPHYNETRAHDLGTMMKRIKDVPVIGLEDCTALKIENNKYEILKSKPDAKAIKFPQEILTTGSLCKLTRRTKL